MADLKISQLTGATTPLAGTEVVPLVQSSTTKKVAVSDLTAGRAVSMASVNVSSSAANSAVAAVYNNDTADGNGMYVKAGGANSGKYNIVLQNAASQDLLAVYADGTVQTGIGNIKINTAAKGVNFTANTPAAGMTSQLLNWYEEGTFTPTYTSDGTPPTCTYSIQDAKYTRIGRMVYFTVEIKTDSATGGTGSLGIAGLPFTSINSRYSGTTNVGFAYAFTTQCPTTGYIPANSTTLYLCFKTSATEISNISAGYLTNAAASNYLLISGSYVV